MSKTLDTADMDIVRTPDGYHRYVCHKRKIMTCGFKERSVLINNAGAFLGSDKALERMRERYLHEEKQSCAPTT